MPDIEIGVGGLDDRRDHGLLQRNGRRNRRTATRPLEDRRHRRCNSQVGGLLVTQLAGGIVGSDVRESIADQLAAGGSRRLMCFSGRGGEIPSTDGTWRVIDRDVEGSMERKKQEGYF